MRVWTTTTAATKTEGDEYELTRELNRLRREGWTIFEILAAAVIDVAVARYVVVAYKDVPDGSETVA
jgi:hypothetical protein